MGDNILRIDHQRNWTGFDSLVFLSSGFKFHAEDFCLCFVTRALLRPVLLNLERNKVSVFKEVIYWLIFLSDILGYILGDFIGNILGDMIGYILCDISDVVVTTNSGSNASQILFAVTSKKSVSFDLNELWHPLTLN